MAGGSTAPGESVLARALTLLRAFDEFHAALPLADLTRRSGLPRSTAHRLATELVSLGLLDRLDDGRYVIGTGLWELGELSPVSLRLREVALPHLLELYEATGENVHLGIRVDDAALYVARVAGPRSIPTLSRMGGRLPLHTTGIGRAMLAASDDAWLAEYWRQPRDRETVHSIVEEHALRERVEDARRLGYAVTRQEQSLGNVSIAAALPPVPGLPPSAVGIVVHLARAQESRLAPLVVRAAQSIATDLSHWMG
jgi:DNA-binding IclR family transcriptional regulator